MYAPQISPLLCWTHTYMYRTYTQTYTHTRISQQTYINTISHKLACIHACTHIYTYGHINTHTHTHSYNALTGTSNVQSWLHSCSQPTTNLQLLHSLGALARLLACMLFQLLVFLHQLFMLLCKSSMLPLQLREADAACLAPHGGGSGSLRSTPRGGFGSSLACSSFTFRGTGCCPPRNSAPCWGW